MSGGNVTPQGEDFRILPVFSTTEVDVEEMLNKQKTLLAACDYLDMRCLASSTLRTNTRGGRVDLENYNSLIDIVTARLTRQAIMAKRHLDRLV